MSRCDPPAQIMAAGLNSVAPSWVVQSDWPTRPRPTSCRTVGSAPPSESLPQPTAVSSVPAAGNESEAAGAPGGDGRGTGRRSGGLRAAQRCEAALGRPARMQPRINSALPKATACRVQPRKPCAGPKPCGRPHGAAAGAPSSPCRPTCGQLDDWLGGGAIEQHQRDVVAPVGAHVLVASVDHHSDRLQRKASPLLPCRSGCCRCQQALAAHTSTLGEQTKGRHRMHVCSPACRPQFRTRKWSTRPQLACSCSYGWQVAPAGQSRW